MKVIKCLLLLALTIWTSGRIQAQGILGGHVTGNVQIDGQISRADSVIGANDVPEKLLTNARADILYTNGNFGAGLRFES